MAKQHDTNAVELLKSDHRAVEELFEDFEASSSEKQKAKLAAQICTELLIHMTIEEELFYPALRGSVDEDILDEGEVEHDCAKVLISEIQSSPGGDHFEAKVKVLSEMIKHHVKEEEQDGGMFEQAEDSDVDLDALGVELSERKAALKLQSEAEGPMKPMMRALLGAPGLKAAE